MRFATVGLGLGLALFMAPGLGLGQDLDKAADKSSNSPTTYELLNLFGDVFERVRGDYVEKTTDRQLIEAAISGMLTSLDPHSSYLNEKTFGKCGSIPRANSADWGSRSPWIAA